MAAKRKNSGESSLQKNKRVCLRTKPPSSLPLSIPVPGGQDLLPPLDPPAQRRQSLRKGKSAVQSSEVPVTIGNSPTAQTISNSPAASLPLVLGPREHAWLESQISLDKTQGGDLLHVMYEFRNLFGIQITFAGVCNKYYSMILTKQFEETPVHQQPLARDHHLRLRSIKVLSDPTEIPGDHALEESYLREGFPAPGQACFSKPPTRRFHPIHPKYTYITSVLLDNGYKWEEVMWLFGVEGMEATFEVGDRFFKISFPTFMARLDKIN